jgi:hypothetical protein
VVASCVDDDVCEDDVEVDANKKANDDDIEEEDDDDDVVFGTTRGGHTG